jgi:hypothetical protein
LLLKEKDVIRHSRPKDAALVLAVNNGSAPNQPGSDQAANNPITEARQRCEAFGQQLGENCMESTPSENVLEAAEIYACSEAERIARPPSPQTAELDSDLLNQLSERRADREKERVKALNANVEVRGYEAALADLPPLGKYPAVFPGFRWTSVAGLTLSLAPAVHDLLPGLFELLRWILAIGFSGAVGAMLIYGILPESPEERGQK